MSIPWYLVTASLLSFSMPDFPQLKLELYRTIGPT